MTPARLTSPNVGLRPTTPLSDAGSLIDPPVSVPSAANARPADTATAAPLLEPPGTCMGFQGLRAGGHGRSKEGPPCANSCVASFPSSTAPCSYSLATAVALVVGTLVAQILECAEVRMPDVL